MIGCNVLLQSYISENKVEQIYIFWLIIQSTFILSSNSAASETGSFLKTSFIKWPKILCILKSQICPRYVAPWNKKKKKSNYIFVTRPLNCTNFICWNEWNIIKLTNIIICRCTCKWEKPIGCYLPSSLILPKTPPPQWMKSACNIWYRRLKNGSSSTTPPG